MAYVILTNEPQTNQFRQLQQELIGALNMATIINRQLDEMTDVQVVDQYGIPSGLVAAFRTNVDGLLTALTSTAVTNFISSMGFDR